MSKLTPKEIYSLATDKVGHLRCDRNFKADETFKKLWKAIYACENTIKYGEDDSKCLIHKDFVESVKINRFS